MFIRRHCTLVFGFLLSCVLISKGFAHWEMPDITNDDLANIIKEMITSSQDKLCTVPTSNSCKLFQEFKTAKTPTLPKSAFFTLAIAHNTETKNIKENELLLLMSNPNIHLGEDKSKVKTVPANCILNHPDNESDWEDANKYITELQKGHHNKEANLYKHIRPALDTEYFVPSMYLENSLFILSNVHCVVRQKGQQLYVLYRAEGKTNLVTMFVVEEKSQKPLKSKK